MTEAEVRELARHLEVLERMNRQNERAYRRWKRCGIGLLGCALVVAVSGAAGRETVDDRGQGVRAPRCAWADPRVFVDPLGWDAGIRHV